MRGPQESFASTETEPSKREGAFPDHWLAITEEDLDPAKASVECLAVLIPLAGCAPELSAGQAGYAQGKSMLAEMTQRALRDRDAAFFRRMVRACELISGKRKFHDGLEGLLQRAWLDLFDEDQRPPTRRELKERLGLVRGGQLWRVYAARYVRKCLAKVVEKMSPDCPPD